MPDKTHGCGCCMPTFDYAATGAVPGEQIVISCILPFMECDGRHVGIRPDGKYIAFTFALEEPCDCEEDDCECFDYDISDTLEDARDPFTIEDEIEIE